MWPLPTLQNDIITISFSPDNLVCSWIQKTDNQSRIEIKAYQRTTLEHLELEKLILFNPTHIKNIITTFTSKLNKNNAFIAFSLHGLSIVEEYITLASSTPKREDFGIPHSSNRLWNYQYLYQNDKGQFVFYLYKVPRSLLLQYKLLAIATKSNLITITTQNIALLQCYKNIALRQSTFAVAMMQHHNNLELLISSEIMQQVMTIPSNICIKEELPYLATSYGLFISQGLHS